MSEIEPTVIPAAPFQQNCSLRVCGETRFGDDRRTHPYGSDAALAHAS